MNVLLIGSGGREHAIAEAVSRSSKLTGLYAAMNYKNPGISQLCEDIYIADDFKNDSYSGVIDFAVNNKIGLAIVGPETPLSDGLADLLWDAGISVVGPRKLAAQIEFDKAWARDLLKNHGIGGCPEYRIFSRYDEAGAKKDTAALEAAACAYIEQLNNVAVKPKGLTGGKGVFVTDDDGDLDEAKAYAKTVLENDDLVIEEKLIGEEFTVQAFVDGSNLAFSPSVQDHKRLKENDEGPNTGGMGSYTDSGDILPFMKQPDYDEAKRIMSDTVNAIENETGVRYKGILYGQFIATAKGISVIEFNARFGDPEAMNVLPLLENDFLDVCTDIVNGTLKQDAIKFKKQATVCKYVVPEGYPKNSKKGVHIKIGDVGRAHLNYASVYEDESDGELYTKGSRAVAAVGIGDTIEDAEAIAEEGLSGISSDNPEDICMRHDIGKKHLLNERILHMKQLRKYAMRSV